MKMEAPDIPISSCSYGSSAIILRRRKLEMARYNIKHGLVDMENVQPDTFGEGGFRDPDELLEWLYENRPNEDLVLSHGDYCRYNLPS